MSEVPLYREKRQSGISSQEITCSVLRLRDLRNRSHDQDSDNNPDMPQMKDRLRDKLIHHITRILRRHSFQCTCRIFGVHAELPTPYTLDHS